MAIKSVNLADAVQNLDAALSSYMSKLSEMRQAVDAKDYDKASAAWKAAHEDVISLKHQHNAVYAHLNSLKPKVEKTPKPPKADKAKEAKANAPEGDDTP